MIFFKQAIYVRYVIAKLSRFVQISLQTSSDSVLHRILENWKEPGTNFQATFFIEFFDKKFSFIMLHKLVKFHYQNVFTRLSKLFSKMCLVFNAWAWCHNIWISGVKIWLSQEQKGVLKWNKKHFSLFHSALFKLTKQTSKNVAAKLLQFLMKIRGVQDFCKFVRANLELHQI